MVWNRYIFLIVIKLLPCSSYSLIYILPEFPLFVKIVEITRRKIKGKDTLLDIKAQHHLIQNYKQYSCYKTEMTHHQHKADSLETGRARIPKINLNIYSANVHCATISEGPVNYNFCAYWQKMTDSLIP